ncbi:hypothetical protein [Photorhabdus laumondii]|uniref:Uncharacterized protein n=1 Tax=Photorhabdus laumondii subsp. clarkei TaxID=2029685 RepID=A0A329VKG7_9GAMM|nr:hypothetical protein [Photorhabdus laumondii]RAW92264.1 hypothetical protein CKY01_04805 [Photorhabdus laumondii subsp. clarkei]
MDGNKLGLGVILIITILFVNANLSYAKNDFIKYNMNKGNVFIKIKQGDTDRTVLFSVEKN